MSRSEVEMSPPTIPPDLFGGHFRSFRKDPPGFLTRLSKLGDLTGFRMGPQKAFFAAHPDHVRDILVVNAHKFIKGRALQRAKAVLGEGLLTSEGAFHLRQRRMIQPAFHRSRIAEYSRTMTAHAARMAEEWPDRATLDIDKEMMKLTLRIVGQTLFSANVEDEEDSVGQAMTTLSGLFDFLLLPFSEWLQKVPLPQTRRFTRARDSLNKVIFAIIDERRRNSVDRGDLLSMLLSAQDQDDGGGMTDEQIRDEALTLFLAGHETTSNALTWTWYLLSQDREAEARLHEELESVLGGRTPEFDDIQKLSYTESVLAESMRLFPPAWAVGRLAVTDHEIEGFTISKGSLVLVSPYVTHRDPRFWADPEQFRPERWQQATVKEAAQNYTYFPFGGGVRRCIGEGFAWAEGILLLALLAQHWRFRLDTDQKIGLNAMITLRPKYGMRMKLERRF
jgi:cytochrome P450